VQGTVTDTNGCVGTLTKPNYVQIAPPPITFSADVLSGCVPLDVQFTSASGGAGTTYIWDYGDGSPVDTAVNPLHTYGDSGVFNVTLNIINAEGCPNTITMNNYIMAGLHPQVGFFAEDTIVCYSEMVAFHDSSSSFVESWYWTFGDGQFGNGSDPTHQYGDTGTFTVSVVATHNGCRDTLIKNDYIVIWPPIAAFSPSPALLIISRYSAFHRPVCWCRDMALDLR
ncbi:MAG TPA: PKD domain-containing protein, partial [Bacteroidales bacterium]|nr:PKD domain-containing protein [Bacteroidales bacterium]